MKTEHSGTYNIGYLWGNVKWGDKKTQPLGGLGSTQDHQLIQG